MSLKGRKLNTSLSFFFSRMIFILLNRGRSKGLNSPELKEELIMMTLRKTWYAYEKKFTFTAEVSILNQISKDLHNYETQYLNKWIDRPTYWQQIRDYLMAMHINYTEIEEV